MSKEYGANGTKKGTDSVNRRRFVKALGIAGSTISIGSLSTTSVAAKNDKNDKVKVKDITGGKEDKIVDRALDDSEVEAIRNELVNRSEVSEQYQSDAFQIRDKENKITYYVVSLSFETNSNDTQAYLLWTSDSRTTTLGSYVKQIGEGDEESYRVTKYEVEDGQLESETRVNTPDEVREFKREFVNSEGSGGVSTQGFPNCNVNYSCVGTTAAKGGLLFGACASCAGGFFPACVACASSGILFVSSDCNLCN